MSNGQIRSFTGANEYCKNHSSGLSLLKPSDCLILLTLCLELFPHLRKMYAE